MGINKLTMKFQGKDLKIEIKVRLTLNKRRKVMGMKRTLKI